MDKAGADVWADTFTQLMAQKKLDVWALHPEESLAPGTWALHPEESLGGDLEGGFQLQLKVSRLQCSRCPWTWGSAHVHTLFHLWWDGDRGQGLVRMRVWGQQCRLCPLDTLSECQVSPASVHVFLSKLVLFILWKYYGDSRDPGQCPEICLGDCCEACDLGLCFLQQVPGPAKGPVVKSINARKGRHAVKGCGCASEARGQQLFTRSNGPTPATVPLLVVDFSEGLSPESDGFLSGGEGTITVPFSLVGGHWKGSLPTAGGHQPPIIGQGSICLSGSSVAESEHKGTPVNLSAPIFHRRGLPGSIQRAFALRGFLFKGHGFVLIPSSRAKGQGPISFSHGPVTPGRDPPLVSYNGLLANGEGSITPSSWASVIRGQDIVTDFTGKGQEGRQSSVTHGDHIEDPTVSAEGSVTFPFIVTGHASDEDPVINMVEAEEEQEGQDLVTAGHTLLLESGAAGSVPISQGSLTLPFSVFGIIKNKGPSYKVSGLHSNGLVTYSYYQKRRLRSRPGKSRCGTHQEEDFCSHRYPRRQRTQPPEDFWICLSLTICILRLLCMYRLSLEPSSSKPDRSSGVHVAALAGMVGYPPRGHPAASQCPLISPSVLFFDSSAGLGVCFLRDDPAGPGSGPPCLRGAPGQMRGGRCRRTPGPPAPVPPRGRQVPRPRPARTRDLSRASSEDLLQSGQRNLTAWSLCLSGGLTSGFLSTFNENQCKPRSTRMTSKTYQRLEEAWKYPL
ncbi:LOW QUALITY PROTEIN: receptor-transporting protein 5 [Callospermophilus lateralis]